MNIIAQPWPWLFSGFAIAIVMLTLIFFGNYFGLSSTYQTICAILGAGKYVDFFKINWKEQLWNLVFVGGVVLGGWIASSFLLYYSEIALSDGTLHFLNDLGLNNNTNPFLPDELFGKDAFAHLKTWIILILGGFLSGFGARYAGGCTSGHFISGLSNLQLPSLITVLCFFLGGILMTNLIIPLILKF